MTREEFRGLNAEAKKEARDAMWEIIKTVSSENEEATSALKILRPSMFPSESTGVSRIGKSSSFANLFESVGDAVDEIEVFKELKVGRKESNNLIKDIIKKGDKENTKWIRFDPEEEVYELVAIGKAPSDWTGYVRVQIVEDDLI